MIIKHIFFLLLLIIASPLTYAQTFLGNETGIDYSNPREYEIGGITVSGTERLNKNTLIMLTGLDAGQRITVPGEKTSEAVRKLWEQGLFSDVKLTVTKIQGNQIFFDIYIQERPRLSFPRITGVRKGEREKILEKVKLIKEKIVTENLVVSAESIIEDHFREKGFLFADATIKQIPDTAEANHVILQIDVDKGKKTKINEIIFHGNKRIDEKRLQRAMKETKEKKFYRIFSTSKLQEKEFEDDKANMIKLYNREGFRDARIIKDSVYKVEDDLVNVEITVSEGDKYYFRDIQWEGNTKYSDGRLDTILGIKKGDVYNQSLLEERLFMDPAGRDITSLYMDNGHLFFNITPVEVMVENDSIDLQIRIYEGKPATIGKVLVSGNTKTNDRVILRELRTKPGQLFRRSAIIRSQRELAQLGYFDPEGFDVITTPNPQAGTVDIEYVVAEKPSDQLTLSGGWGAGVVVGTLGLTFNNFSVRNIPRGEAWTPLPSGDGQRLSINAQSNGTWFQSYNFSFTEPWLGGKKPNSLTVGAYHSVQSNGQPKKITVDGEKIMNPERGFLKVWGSSVGYGKRLRIPDDYFSVFGQLSYQNYHLENMRSTFPFSDGFYNNLSVTGTFSRNSIDYPLYPRTGSKMSMSFQTTYPYSIHDSRDFKMLTDQEKFKWLEYHKTKFHSTWYTNFGRGRGSDEEKKGGLARNLVLATSVNLGFLGHYNSDIGNPPFERFYMGGSGLTGFALDGREIIALRGYDDLSIVPEDGNNVNNNQGAIIAAKYTMELRYPFTLNPNATIYGLGFLEAGNTWSKFRDFDPFAVKRTAGLGIRVFLPMFGLLGLDYGWPLDVVPGNPLPGKGGKLTFSIGANMSDWNP